MKKLFLLLTGFFIAIALNAQVYSTYTSTAAGEMSVKFTTSTVTNLTVTGPIDYRDFKFIASMNSHLTSLDISNANVVEYNSGTKTYPKDVIPDSAFYKCFNLAAIKLPPNIVAFGDCAFYECKQLSKLIIPATVTSIGKESLYITGGTNVTTHSYYFFSKTPFPNLNTNAIRFMHSTLGVYVPYGLVQTYTDASDKTRIPQYFEMNGVLLTNTNDTVSSISATYNNVFTGKGNWTATSDSPWLTVDNPTGLNGGTVSYTLSANHTTAKRSATIIISTLQEISYSPINLVYAIADTLTIVQEGESPYTTIQSNSINIVNTATVTVNSNVTWTAVSDQSWLTVATNGTNINLTATINQTLTERTATVTIKGNGIADQIITITQPAGIEFVDVNNAIGTVDYTANSTVSFAVTSNTSWTVTSNDSWLTTSTLQTNGNGTIEFKAISDNPFVTTRTATANIQYSIKGVPATKTLTINQNPGIGTVSILKDSISIGKDTNSIATATVTSNTTLYPISSEPWLTATITNSVITFTAKANPMSIPRHAKVTVWAGNIKDSIIVTQKPADVIITIDTTTIEFSSASNYKNIYAISNAGYIQVTSDQSWLTVTSVGSQNSISFIASANAGESRVAIITVYAADEVNPVGNVSKTIKVIQAGIKDTTTAVGLITNEISLYPNPTTSFIKIKNAGISNVKIVNTNGITLIEKQITDDELINVENLSTGYYIANINGKVISFIKK